MGVFSNSCIFAKLAVHLWGLYKPRGHTVWKMGTITMWMQNSDVPEVCHYMEFLPSKSRSSWTENAFQVVFPDHYILMWP